MHTLSPDFLYILVCICRLHVSMVLAALTARNLQNRRRIHKVDNGSNLRQRSLPHLKVGILSDKHSFFPCSKLRFSAPRHHPFLIELRVSELRNYLLAWDWDFVRYSFDFVRYVYFFPLGVASWYYRRVREYESLRIPCFPGA